MYFAIRNRILAAAALALGLGAGAAELQPSAALSLPARFELTGGTVRVQASHPFQVIVLENRRLSGEITIEEGPKFPSARVLARLSATEFRHSSHYVEAQVAQILAAKANPDILFTSDIADVRPGRRQGESEVTLSGQLTIAGTKIDCGIPAVCAISPDTLQCRFDFPMRLSELHLSPPAPLKIPFRDVVSIRGEWSALRNRAQAVVPSPDPAAASEAFPSGVAQ